MSDTNKLFDLKFVDKNVYNSKKNPDKYAKDRENFRKYFEDEGKADDDLGQINFNTSSKQINKIIDNSEPLINYVNTGGNKLPIENGITQQDFIRSTSTSRYNNDSGSVLNDPSVSAKLIEQTSNPLQRFVIERVRSISIDSRDRDLTLYPNPSSYKIDLSSQRYQNISKIQLANTEFVNTSQLIKSTPVSQRNNIIQWNIQEDISGDYIVYSATLTPGNYTETTLATEIENRMNEVQRANGLYPNFVVSIDALTDTVTISNISFATFANPFSVTSGSSIITVTYSSHPFLPGNRITISNSIQVDGIPANIINGEHVVLEKIDNDTFTIDVSIVATSNDATAGGDAVNIGIGSPFRLLFSQPFNPSEILGFSAEDTEFNSTIENTEEIFNYGSETDLATDRRLKINKVYQNPVDANRTNIRTTTPHLLSDGDRIFMYDSNYLLYNIDTTIEPYTHIYTGANPQTTDDTNIAKQFAGELADPSGWYITVEDSFTFSVPLSFRDYTTDVGGQLLSDWIDANITDEDENGDIIIKDINAAIDLIGNQYYVMTSNIIGGDLAMSNNSISNAFAKIQLVGSSSSSMFNGFAGGTKVFLDTPLASLNEIDIQFVYNDGTEVIFNDRNHSFTLVITEEIQKIEGIGYSSRIGART